MRPIGQDNAPLMATFTVYRAKAKVTDTTPTYETTGITYNDAVTVLFATIGQFLNFMQRHDHRGFNYKASSDGGATFVNPDDKAGV